jgi:BlaI family penicillinase repressor
MHKPSITDAELDIMKVLWEKGAATSQEILRGVSGDESKNRNTVKTLLLRLIGKGAAEYEKIGARTYRYKPVISEQEYLAQSSRHFLDRLFDGSAKKLILNFVEQEKISKAELEELIKQIGDE